MRPPLKRLLHRALYPGYIACYIARVEEPFLLPLPEGGYVVSVLAASGITKGFAMLAVSWGGILMLAMAAFCP